MVSIDHSCNESLEHPVERRGNIDIQIPVFSIKTYNLQERELSLLQEITVLCLYNSLARIYTY
jgi:hypothetical protein